MTESNFNTEHYVNWISSELRPNVYIVATLKQAMLCDDGIRFYLLRGDKDRYAQTYDQFIRRLSKKVYGRTNWRRNHKLVPNMMTCEGTGPKQYSKGLRKKGKRPYDIQSGQDGVRYHLNICLRRPDWISFEDFEKAVRTVWRTIDWGMPDILIEERTGDCVGYSLKEGPKALLPNSMSF